MNAFIQAPVYNSARENLVRYPWATASDTHMTLDKDSPNTQCTHLSELREHRSKSDARDYFTARSHAAEKVSVSPANPSASVNARPMIIRSAGGDSADVASAVSAHSCGSCPPHKHWSYAEYHSLTGTQSQHSTPPTGRHGPSNYFCNHHQQCPHWHQQRHHSSHSCIPFQSDRCPEGSPVNAGNKRSRSYSSIARLGIDSDGKGARSSALAGFDLSEKDGTLYVWKDGRVQIHHAKSDSTAMDTLPSGQHVHYVWREGNVERLVTDSNNVRILIERVLFPETCCNFLLI